MALCLNALSCFDVARTSRGPGHRKYKQAAQKFLKKIKGLVNQGNLNMQHWVALLRAEFEVLNGNNFLAKNDYESAIALASRFGFNQDAALACERYGAFLLNEMDDAENGCLYQLQQAVRRYSEWGAFGKVEVLEKTFADLLRTKPDEIVAFRL
jgi:hypothetical protein